MKDERVEKYGEYAYEHLPINNLKLDFPYMYSDIEGKIYKVDIRDLVEEMKENKHAYPHYKKLLDPNFFNLAHIDGSYAICWDDYVDVDSRIFLEGIVI